MVDKTAKEEGTTTMKFPYDDIMDIIKADGGSSRATNPEKPLGEKGTEDWKPAR